MRKGTKGKKRVRRKNRPKDSGSAVRLEQGREREVISVKTVNCSGTEAAKTLHGTFRVRARRDSRLERKY